MSAGPIPERFEGVAAWELNGPAREEIALAPVLAALSDPLRLEIVVKLANGSELSCGSLGLPVAKSTLTHHLKVLREAGVLTHRRVGTSKLSVLRRSDLDARFPGLLDSILGARVQQQSARR